MKLKIGVMGSATGRMSKVQRELSCRLGTAIAEEGCVTITGGGARPPACPCRTIGAPPFIRL